MKLQVSILLFFLCSIAGYAQNFETLLPQDYPVGEELPVFKTQLHLATGQTSNNVEVIVEYPEYKKYIPDVNEDIIHKALAKVNMKVKSKQITDLIISRYNLIEK